MKINVEVNSRSTEPTLEGLCIIKPRRTNGRILCDVVDKDGILVLSGNAEWVVDTCYQRGYSIENWDTASTTLANMGASWGTY